MKRILLTGISLLLINLVSGQQYKFYYSNNVKFLKSNNDSLRMPFTGGMNAPQFSNIDLDGDGVKDLFVFDRVGNKALTFVKTANGYVHTPQYDGKFPRMTGWCLLRDYDADGKLDIFTEVSIDTTDLIDTVQVPYLGNLRLLKNVSTASSPLKFKQLHNMEMDTGGVWTDWGVPKDRESISINTGDIAGIDDMDGDGDADILTFFSFNANVYYYENYMKNKYNFPYSPDSTRFIQRDQCWGYFQYYVSPGSNRFQLHMGRDSIPSCFNQMYEKQSMHTATTLFMIDHNGDGVKDIVYGDGAYNNLILLINGRNQNSLGRDSITSQDTMFPSNTTPAQFIIYPVGYYVDVDGDGLNELLVTTNEPVAAKSVNNVWIYTNTGTNNHPVFEYQGNDFFGYNETIDLGTRSAPVLVDIDNDGDEDLIVGTNGDYAKTKNINDRLVLFENIGKVNGRAVFSLADTNFLMLSKDTPILMLHPTFADLNGDQKKDLLIGDANGNIQYYQNAGSGTNYSFVLQTRKLGNIDAGTNAAPAFADLDNDGDLDLVVGNRDGVLKYYQNTGSSTSAQFASTVTIDSFGKVLVRDQTVTLFGPYYQSYGNASPVFYDLDKDGTLELVVGSDGGKIAVYTGISTIAGAVFNKQENMFVDYSDSLNARAIRFGVMSAPCIGLLDEDDKPDLMIGNILGGLSFYSSINGNPHVGLNDNISKNENHFRLYPNPSKDMIYLDHSNIQSDGTYKVYNQMGQIVMRGNISHYYAESVINISNLPSGFYFINLSGASYNETHKFIVGK